MFNAISVISNCYVCQNSEYFFVTLLSTDSSLITYFTRRHYLNVHLSKSKCIQKYALFLTTQNKNMYMYDKDQNKTIMLNPIKNYF